MTAEEFLEKMSRLPSDYELLVVTESGVARKVSNIQVSKEKKVVWVVGGEILFINNKDKQ